MANPDGSSEPAAASEPASAAPTATVAATEAPPVIAAPETAPAAAPEAPAVAAPAEPIAAAADSTAEIAAAESTPSRLRRHLPLAAGIALAVALGTLAGGAMTFGLMHDAALPAATAAAETARALQDSMARMEAEIARLKAGINTTQRSTGAQFAKLAERLERAEKAQVEPAARLAKIAESLERVEKHIPQAAARPAPDVTGSVTVAKQDAKPPLAEGWRLLDVYAGRAVVENRTGRVFEVGPGSNLPGLGRVEAVKREDGRVVVVTRNGVIASAVERRRLPRYYQD